MIRAVSYGGGVQSTALLVLAAQREIDFPLFLFANTGDDSEHPATLRYVREIATPYAEANGIELVEIARTKRDGTHETLRGRIESGARTVPIPARMSGSGAPGNRTCTVDFKIKPIAKELKQRGATADDPALVALGISLDEFHRMRTDSGIPHEIHTYPLIERRLTRQDCINIIERASVPVPPKSSCFFCPFFRLSRWQEMARKEPTIFLEAVKVERTLNERRAQLGKDQVWLSTALRPLDEAVSDDGQMDLFDDQTCDTAGYCMI